MCAESKPVKRGLGQFDMVCSLITAVFFVDTIASVSTMGFASVTWILLIVAIFFLPASLTVAELGAAYPENGGFYTWAKRAFGGRWASRIGWIYWTSTCIWISSVATLIVNVLCQISCLDLPQPFMTGGKIAVIWAILGLAARPHESARRMTNFSCIAKFVLGGSLVAAAICRLASGHGIANVLTLGSFTPKVGTAIAFIPALVDNFLGFEVICSDSSALENPARDVPRAALKNCGLVTLLYLVTVPAVLIILPVDRISIIRGLVDSYRIGFGASAISTLLTCALGVLFIIVLFCQCMTWTLSSCRVAQASARNGELPAGLAAENAGGAPTGALFVSGSIASLMTLASGFLTGSAESVFWSIFSCMSFLQMIPYLVNFEVYLRLKRSDRRTPRPYRFPGPAWLSVMFARIGELVCAATMVLFIWVPGAPFNAEGALFVAVGVLLTLGIGEVLLRRRGRSRRVRTGLSGETGSAHLAAKLPQLTFE